MSQTTTHTTAHHQHYAVPKSFIGKRGITIFSYGLMILLGILCAIPFYLMFINATRSNNEIFSGVSFLPSNHLVDNFMNLIFGKVSAVDKSVRGNGLNIPQGFLNSAVIAVSATLLSGYFSAMTAFCFSLYKFKLKKILWGLIMVVIMLPPTVGLIGYFKLISGLNMLDTYWPLILPAIASPFAVFFIRQFITGSLPISLVEAARIDGAGEFMIFNRIVLPLSMPGIATVSIMGFLGSWNNYLGPLIVLDKKSLFTLPLLIQQLNTTLYNRDFGAMYMGVALSVFPILIAFSILSRFLIEGISSGAVKE